jgi:cbb3-type cytochrome c oxidase subunit III
MMRKLTLMLLSALCLSVLSSTHMAFQAAVNAQNPSDAAKLFEKNCATCHGKDGRAKTFKGKMNGARNLTDPTWQSQATDERIVGAIKKGPGAMPSFEKKFTEAEIASLVTFVRGLKGTAPPDKKH